MTPPRDSQRSISPPPKDKKRARTSRNSNSCSGPDEDQNSSDIEVNQSNIPGESTIRHGQAERKRELERNRRNLVNVRFAELEAELRRSVPPVDSLCGIPTLHSASLEKGKRIDKEAVLKEAAQRLALQRKELSSMCGRMSSMTGEINNLRSEKCELRDDKNYLRSELETVRGELQRLRSDNINLWQALRKAAAFKDSFSPDVAKLPIELFLRSGQQLPPQVSAPQPANASTSSGSTLRQSPYPRQSFPMSDLEFNQPPQMQPSNNVPQQVAQQEQQAMFLSQLDTQTNQEAQQNIQTSSTRPMSLFTPGNESFLILQNADEIGDLFNNYVPGAVGGPLRQSQTPSVPSNSTSNVRDTTDTRPNSHRLPMDKETTQFGSPNFAQFATRNNDQIRSGNMLATKPKQSELPYNGDLSSIRNEIGSNTDKSSDDPFPDIAPCV